MPENKNKSNGAPVGKKRILSSEEAHVANLMGFNDNPERLKMFADNPEDEVLMPDLGMEAEVPVEAPAVPEIAVTEEVAPVETPSPMKEKINVIKDLIAGEDIDKSVKSEGEKLIARLEEAEKILSDVEDFLKKNEKVPEAAPETEVVEEVAPMTA